jgi:predicted transcriptional regulator
MLPLLVRTMKGPKRGRKPAKAMDSPHRRRMFEIIQAEPGIMPTTLKESFSLDWSPFSYHLRMLVKARLVRVEVDAADQRCRRLYATDARRAEDLPTGAVSDAARRVGLLVAMNPGATASTIAQMASIPERTTYHHLKRLLEAGLISSGSDTRYVDLRAQPSLYAVLGLPEPGKAFRP